MFVGCSFIVCGRADFNDLTNLNIWEFKLESESVPVVTSRVSKLKLVSVFIEIVDAKNLGNDIEVLGLFLGS